MVRGGDTPSLATLVPHANRVYALFAWAPPERFPQMRPTFEKIAASFVPKPFPVLDEKTFRDDLQAWLRAQRAVAAALRARRQPTPQELTELGGRAWVGWDLWGGGRAQAAAAPWGDTNSPEAAALVEQADHDLTSAREIAKRAAQDRDAADARVDWLRAEWRP